VIAMTGTDSKVVHRALPVDDPRRRRPDIGRAQQLLGWKPRVALQQGLEATVQWFAAEMEEATLSAVALAMAEPSRKAAPPASIATAAE
jgi:UDP-glucuronate decarboxylase